jgi:hypothetical protein
MNRRPTVWGATPAEHTRPYPADDLVVGRAVRMTRAVTVHASLAMAYRWLCQVTQAPYSYDLLDNRGRRSPREITPGAIDLEPGQELLGLFTLVDIRPGRQFTMRGLPRATRLFGPLAMTYAVEPRSAVECRLLCRLVAGTPTPASRIRGIALMWGDLIMMRRQLLTLRNLAERDERRAARAA